MAQPRDSRGRFTKKGGGVEVASLFGTLGLDIDRASWKRADQQIEGIRAKLANGLAKASARVEAVLGGLGAKIVAAFGAAGFVKLSDTYTNLENRLRQVAEGEEHLQELMQRTKSIADQTRSSWAATGEAYVRLTNATKELGLSEERRLKILETLNMALQSSGATASEAAAGTLQLMQGLSAGALQGDEFRSIAEQLPDLLDLFAKEMGVSRGQLKKLGAEGKITSKVVIAALENASETIRERFMKSTATAGQLWAVFKNSLTEAAGELARNADFIAAVKAVFDGLATVLPYVVKGIAAAAGVLRDLYDFLSSGSDEAVAALIGIAVAIGTVVVPALYSMVAAWVAALAPILAVVAAVGLVALGVLKLVKHWDKIKAAAVRAWNAIKDSAGRAWDWITSKAAAAVNFVLGIPGRIAEKFWAMVDAIKTFFADAFDWIVEQAKQLPEKIWRVIKKIPVIGHIARGAEWAFDKLDELSNGPIDVGKAFDWARQQAQVQAQAGASGATVATPVLTPMFSPSPNAGRVNNVGPTTMNITVNGAPGMDEEQLANRVGVIVDRRLAAHLVAED